MTDKYVGRIAGIIITLLIMFIIGFFIFTLDGVGGDAGSDQCRRYVVLGAQRVGSAEDKVSASRL